MKPDDPPPWYSPEVLKKRLWESRWFVAIVAVPGFLSVVYFGLIAADRYEAEARFVVRTPSSSTAAQISNLVQGSGAIRSADDAYIVHAYMKSRDAVRSLVADYSLLERMQRSEADFMWRYPGYFRSPSDEKLWRHFQNFIGIDFDNSTGITTLKIQAFQPGDAEALANGLLVASERLINSISDRSQAEALRAASTEVKRSRSIAQEALERVSAFRRQNEIIDPTLSSKASLETITRLALEIAKTSAELAELQKVAAESPQALTLSRRIAAYQEQIVKERKLLAGSDTSLAPLIATYERLILQREFAERTFASAQIAHDLARIDAERQRLFIERVATPSLPDYPKYPYRLWNIFGVLFLLWLVYAVATKVAADSKGHAGH